MHTTCSIPAIHSAGNNTKLLVRSCTVPFPVCYKGFSFVYSFIKSPKETVFTRHQPKHLTKQEQCFKWAITLQYVPKLAMAEPKPCFKEQGTKGKNTKAAMGQTVVHHLVNLGHKTLTKGEGRCELGKHQLFRGQVQSKQVTGS